MTTDHIWQRSNRNFSLFATASRQGVTVKQIQEELPASTKTVRRDLVSLLEAGFPMEESSGEYGRKSWRLDPSWDQNGLLFTYDEALALYLARQCLDGLAGTLIWESAQRAFKKIQTALGSGARNYLEKMAPSFGWTMFGTGDYASQGDLIDRLCIGIEDRKVVFITYRSQQATEPVTYPTHPYRIMRYRGYWEFLEPENRRSPKHSAMKRIVPR